VRIPKESSWWKLPPLALLIATAAMAGTFGRVIPLGGHAADLALDEARQSVYVANFTANRIDVISMATESVTTSIPLPPQPASVALSHDGRFLLVTHFGNFLPPNTPFCGLTVIELPDRGTRTVALADPPLGAAFTLDGWALVVTSREFLRFHPVTGAVEVLDTVENVSANTLPAPPPNFPPQIVAASVAASADGLMVYGLTDTIRFRYDHIARRIFSLGYTAKPPLGPRVVSVDRYGTLYAAGWALFNWKGNLLAQFPHASGQLHVGSHAIDTDRNLLYAQVPEQEGEPPVLMVADADNLTIRERLQLPENLAGRSALTSDGATLYAISDSGLMILPVGGWATRERRLVTSEEQIFLQANFCDARAPSIEFRVEDTSGQATDFDVTSSEPGIRVLPEFGTTPATLRVTVDPVVYATRRGTVEAWLTIRSAGAVNLPPPVRVLVNFRDSDQRGTVIPVPGKLVDILADPVRDRFYVLRQDRNMVLVFDGLTRRLLTTLRTGNTPTQMAITPDRRHLLVANDNSQLANVFDLETLEATHPVVFPPGRYPRSIACSARAVLAASRVMGPQNTIDRVDFQARLATEMPALGVYQNTVNMNTVLVASPNGATILAAQADGGVLLYNASADTFTIARKDFTGLAGPYAASASGLFLVDNVLLNPSLVPVRRLDTGGGRAAGFAFLGENGVMTTIPAGDLPGVIQRVEPARPGNIRPTRMAESPLYGEAGAALTRTLAPLANQNAIISLTASGLTVLPWEYDALTPSPRITAVVSAADFTPAVASGGLISVFGENLGPVSQATSELPLPTALAESCLTVNGRAVPMLYVSPGQINAQLPFEVEGPATMILHTPAGVSESFALTVAGAAGPVKNIPTIVRAANGELATPANPVHWGDTVVIYVTGLGRTTPAVEQGVPAPFDPLAVALVQPEVTLGGVRLPLAYAGMSPGLVGVYQINAVVPYGTPSGLGVPLTISQGGASTTLQVRVVE